MGASTAKCGDLADNRGLGGGGTRRAAVLCRLLARIQQFDRHLLARSAMAAEDDLGIATLTENRIGRLKRPKWKNWWSAVGLRVVGLVRRCRSRLFDVGPPACDGLADRACHSSRTKLDFALPVAPVRLA